MLSEISRKRLVTCDHRLQQLMIAVSEKTMISVSCGHRGFIEQTKAFLNGYSKLPWPRSLHNKKPSRAVDIIPLPLDWDDKESFVRLSEVVKETAAELKIPIEWGGDWKKFIDMPHYQLPKGVV